MGEEGVERVDEDEDHEAGTEDPGDENDELSPAPHPPSFPPPPFLYPSNDATTSIPLELPLPQDLMDPPSPTPMSTEVTTIERGVVFTWGSDTRGGALGTRVLESEGYGTRRPSSRSVIQNQKRSPPLQCAVDSEGHCAMPVRVSGFGDEVTSVAAGHKVTGAVTAGGVLFTWGKGLALGHGGGTLKVVDAPKRVVFRTKMRTIGKQSTNATTLAVEESAQDSDDVTVDGTGSRKNSDVAQRGKDSLPQPVNDYERVTSVSFGLSHALALNRHMGIVWAWGSNRFGQLGSGNDFGDSRMRKNRSSRNKVAINTLTPHRVAFFSNAANGEEAVETTATNVTSEHSGLRHREQVILVACCDNYSAAVTSFGRLFTWGEGGCLGHAQVHGQQQQRSKVGNRVNFVGEGREDIKANDFYSKRSKSGGNHNKTEILTKWDDETAYPFVRPRNKPLPLLVEALDGKEVVTGVGLGSLYMGCVTAAGSCYTWGYGGHGNLGHSDRKSHLLPKRVDAFEVMPPAIADTPTRFDPSCFAQTSSSWSSSRRFLDNRQRMVVGVACAVGQRSVPGGLNPKMPGSEGPHTLFIVQEYGGRHVYSCGTCHKGMLGNLAKNALSGPHDELAPYRIGSHCRDGKELPLFTGLSDFEYALSSTLSSSNAATTSPIQSQSTLLPRYVTFERDELIGSATGIASAAMHSLIWNDRGEIWAFGCGSDARCGVASFAVGDNPERPRKNRMKPYMSAPQRVGAVWPPTKRHAEALNTVGLTPTLEHAFVKGAASSYSHGICVADVKKIIRRNTLHVPHQHHQNHKVDNHDSRMNLEQNASNTATNVAANIRHEKQQTRNLTNCSGSSAFFISTPAWHDTENKRSSKVEHYSDRPMRSNNRAAITPTTPLTKGGVFKPGYSGKKFGCRRLKAPQTPAGASSSSSSSSS